MSCHTEYEIGNMSEEEAKLKAEMLVLWCIANGWSNEQIKAAARRLQGKE